MDPALDEQKKAVLPFMQARFPLLSVIAMQIPDYRLNELACFAFTAEGSRNTEGRPKSCVLLQTVCHRPGGLCHTSDHP